MNHTLNSIFQSLPSFSPQGLGVVSDVNLRTESILFLEEDTALGKSTMVTEYPVANMDLLQQVNKGDLVIFTLQGPIQGSYKISEISIVKHQQ